MKLLFLGLIFVSISYIGFQYGHGYKIKENFYNEFANFLIFLKSQIGFLKTDLISIFKNYETKNKSFNLNPRGKSRDIKFFKEFRKK